MSEILEKVVSLFEQDGYFKETIPTRTGSTVSSYTGPNTVRIIGIYK